MMASVLKFKVIFIFLLYCGNLQAARPIQKGCALKISESYEKLSPIFIDSHTNKLAMPSNEIFALKKGESIKLACPDPKNSLTATNTNLTSATCLQDNTLKIDDKNFELEELQCQKIIKGSTYRTNEKCGGEGLITNLGYRLAKNNFITLIKICYNEAKGNALYSEHLIYGKEIKHASKTRYRPGFSTAGLGSVAAAVAYKQAFQKSTFNKLLKSASLASNYITDKSFLSRGHLSLDADFLLAPWQYTTYFYINVCPQWQVINTGNWKSLEANVRKAADKHKDTFRIITGTSGVLTLPDASKQEREVYLLPGNKLAVPKYLWKIVYSEKLQQGVAFFVLNNPFVEAIEENDLLCKNICEEMNWGSSHWSNPAHGFVTCCDVRDVLDKIYELPNLKIKGVLKGAN